MNGQLITKIFNQLTEENPDKEISIDCFSDGSGSWIEIKPKKLDLTKPSFYTTVLSFNGRGTKIYSVHTYREDIEITTNLN